MLRPLWYPTAWKLPIEIPQLSNAAIVGTYYKHKNLFFMQSKTLGQKVRSMVTSLKLFLKVFTA